MSKDHKGVLAATKIGVKDKIPVMRGSFLRFPRAMREVARVSHLGCIKYDAPEGSMDYLETEDGYGVFTDALGRHLLDEATGGKVNVETGGHLPPEGMVVLHQAQAAWNTLARLERYLVDLEVAGHNVEEILAAELQCRAFNREADRMDAMDKQNYEDVSKEALDEEFGSYPQI